MEDPRVVEEKSKNALKILSKKIECAIFEMENFDEVFLREIIFTKNHEMNCRVLKLLASAKISRNYKEIGISTSIQNCRRPNIIE